MTEINLRLASTVKIANPANTASTNTGANFSTILDDSKFYKHVYGDPDRAVRLLQSTARRQAGAVHQGPLSLRKRNQGERRDIDFQNATFVDGVLVSRASGNAQEGVSKHLGKKLKQLIFFNFLSNHTTFLLLHIALRRNECLDNGRTC